MIDIQKEINENPIYFLDYVLGSEHWSGQDMIFNSVFKNQRSTIKSCHGIGKSYIVSRIALAFLYAHKDSIVVTTAPTFRQVENIIWRELRGAHANSKVPLGGNLLKTQLELDTNWYAMGISSDKSDAFQGLHAKSGYILVIVDEAAGIEEQILEVIEALLTSEHVYLVYIGNPTKGNGSFYESFKSVLFHKLSISCLNTPNFTYNSIISIEQLEVMTREEVKALPLIYPELITPIWVWERIYAWGKDSPIFMARCMAQFPEESDSTLIPLYLVEKALTVKLTEKANPLFWHERHIGIDVARFGEDTTVFTATKANLHNEIEHTHTQQCTKRDTMEVVGRAVKMFKDLEYDVNIDSFIVDDTGLGGGVTDRLVELGYIVTPVNFACKASDEDQEEIFNSLKAEMFWNLRDLFKSGKLKLRDLGRVVAEVPTVKYDFDSNGRIKMVPKKKKKNVSEVNTPDNKSPDYADSLALACFNFTKHATSVYTTNVIKEERPKRKRRSNTIAGNMLNKTY